MAVRNGPDHRMPIAQLAGHYVSVEFVGRKL